MKTNGWLKEVVNNRFAAKWLKQTMKQSYDPYDQLKLLETKIENTFGKKISLCDKPNSKTREALMQTRKSKDKQMVQKRGASKISRKEQNTWEYLERSKGEKVKVDRVDGVKCSYNLSLPKLNEKGIENEEIVTQSDTKNVTQSFTQGEKRDNPFKVKGDKEQIILSITNRRINSKCKCKCKCKSPSGARKNKSNLKVDAKKRGETSTAPRVSKYEHYVEAKKRGEILIAPEIRENSLKIEAEGWSKTTTAPGVNKAKKRGENMVTKYSKEHEAKELINAGETTGKPKIINTKESKLQHKAKGTEGKRETEEKDKQERERKDGETETF